MACDACYGHIEGESLEKENKAQKAEEKAREEYALKVFVIKNNERKQK